MKKTLSRIIAERVEQLRDEKDISIATLCYNSALPFSTLSHILKADIKNPGIKTLVKVCDGLGVTLQEFFDTPEFEEAIIDARIED